MKIPNGWKKVKFEDIVSKINDKVTNRDDWTFDRYIGGEHFDEGEMRISRSAPIKGNEEVIGPAFNMRFKPGQVLYVTRNPRLRKGGMVDFEGVCSNVSFIMGADETKLLQSLLPFVIQTEDFVKHTCNNAHGSTNPFLNWKDIAKYEFLLPSIEEQKKINEVLWGVEENIFILNKHLTNLEFFETKILKDSFSLGKDIIEMVKLSKNKDKKTKLHKLSEVTTLITKGTTPTTYGMNFISEGINFIKAESIDEYGKFIKKNIAYIDEATHNYLKRSQFNERDVLFSIAGVLGRVAIVTKSILPANTNQAIAIIRPNLNLINEEYLSYYLKSKVVQKYIELFAVQTAQANVSLGLLGDLPIFIPDLETQKEMVIKLKKVDQYRNMYRQHRIILKNLRNKLSNELLKGELRLD